MEYMNSEECAKYIGVHVNTLYKYVHEGGLPVFRLPGRSKFKFRKDLVDGWIFEMSQPKLTVKGKEVKYKENNGEYGKLRVMIP